MKIQNINTIQNHFLKNILRLLAPSGGFFDTGIPQFIQDCSVVLFSVWQYRHFTFSTDMINGSSIDDIVAVSAWAAEMDAI